MAANRHLSRSVTEPSPAIPQLKTEPGLDLNGRSRPLLKPPKPPRPRRLRSVTPPTYLRTQLHSCIFSPNPPCPQSYYSNLRGREPRRDRTVAVAAVRRAPEENETNPSRGHRAAGPPPRLRCASPLRNGLRRAGVCPARRLHRHPQTRRPRRLDEQPVFSRDRDGPAGGAGRGRPVLRRTVRIFLPRLRRDLRCR